MRFTTKLENRQMLFLLSKFLISEHFLIYRKPYYEISDIFRLSIVPNARIIQKPEKKYEETGSEKGRKKIDKNIVTRILILFLKNL